MIPALRGIQRAVAAPVDQPVLAVDAAGPPPFWAAKAVNRGEIRR
jgi:uncharacterized membrane protein